MIDLVVWSFAVAALPLVLALALSMLASAMGARPRAATHSTAWPASDRIRFRTTDRATFEPAHFARSGGRFHDF